jgi:hypothetical protein
MKRSDAALFLFFSATSAQVDLPNMVTMGIFNHRSRLFGDRDRAHSFSNGPVFRPLHRSHSAHWHEIGNDDVGAQTQSHLIAQLNDF